MVTIVTGLFSVKYALKRKNGVCCVWPVKRLKKQCIVHGSACPVGILLDVVILCKM
jgi:hypothetical protein